MTIRTMGLAAADGSGWQTLADYAPHWHQTVMNDCDDLTVLDYERGLVDALAVAGEYTLEQLEAAPLLVDEIKARLRKRKTYSPPRRKRDGEGPPLPPHFHTAAADKALKILSAICSHALERNIIRHNPFAGVKRFHRSRGPSGNSGHRRIFRSEVLHPRTVAHAALGFRGSIAVVERDRLIPELIAYEGMRPEHVVAMRHRWWRNEDGPRPYILLREAVKDLGFALVTGEAKTGVHEPVLWPAIAEQLERVWQAQGRPGLDTLVCPNARGTFLDWGNWRRRWYRALHISGIAEGPETDSPGAFEPYLCRHIAAVTMTHAQRPEHVGGGVYSRYEVARHLGHTVQTLDRVYADVPDDLLGIAGLTMDEIIRRARREQWGPIPGDTDYEETTYTIAEAAELTGRSVGAIGARVSRGALPANRENGLLRVSDHHLVLLGLLAPVPKR